MKDLVEEFKKEIREEKSKMSKKEKRKAEDSRGGVESRSGRVQEE